jgi:hypothetical protein
MKAFKVITETQEFIVTAYTLAEVVEAYADCDVSCVRLLGEVVPLRVRTEVQTDDELVAAYRKARNDADEYRERILVDEITARARDHVRNAGKETVPFQGRVRVFDTSTQNDDKETQDAARAFRKYTDGICCGE